MITTKKIALLLILAGICLPTAPMPFITEFHPQPGICLSSNFFGNLGNMMLAIGQLHIPYRYLFSSGVVLTCIGLGMLVLSSGRPLSSRD